MKKFYKWQCEDERAEITKWIKTTMKKRNQKLPEEMLSESDVLCLIENAESMKAARVAYEGIPIKTIIKTDVEGDICYFCGKPFGKDNKCRCTAKGEYVKKKTKTA